MIYFSDKAIIQGVKLKKETVIRYLYKEYFPCILTMVEQNSGVYEDAEDVFQDGMIILYRKCTADKVKLNCSLKTFFYAVCRNIWLQRLERTKRLVFREDVEVREQGSHYILRDQEYREDELERLRYFQMHFLGLPKDCQRLLLLCFDKVPMKEIARVMGVSGVNYVKTRKYACKNLLRKKIMNDPASAAYLIQHGK